MNEKEQKEEKSNIVDPLSKKEKSILLKHKKLKMGQQTNTYLITKNKNNKKRNTLKSIHVIVA